MASEDEFFYSEGEDEADDNYSYDSSMDDDSSENKSPTTFAKSYSVLNEVDIRRRQEEEIERVSSTFSLSKSSATLLLCHYNWEGDNLLDAWFVDEARIRSTIGLLEQKTAISESTPELTCGICLDTLPRDRMSAAACGHPYCTDCWDGYIRSSINDGPGCLSLRCPHPSCHAAIDGNMIQELAAVEDYGKYSRFLVRSYVEGRKITKIKWCPSPGCEYAVEITGCGHFDIECKCSHRFCWGCTEEAHRPVKCETVAKWIEKNKSDAENTNWLLANSKPCPKCKRSIEKNHGCMHMTCTPPCKFEFCWLCLEEWSKHDVNRGGGGYYSCNRYEEAKREGAYDEEVMKRQHAKESLYRYTHYYERWSSNNSSMMKAMESRRRLEKGGLVELTKNLQGEMTVQVYFILNAWAQIVECRRVLKWSYAYGYFLPMNEKTKKMLFEDLQGQAESGLERLHHCAEEEFRQLVASINDRAGKLAKEEFSKEEAEKDISDLLQDFRMKLMDLTSVTKKYFDNFVEAFESGLGEVVWEEGDDGKSKVIDDLDQIDHWYCTRCSFANNLNSNFCEMCMGDREDPDEDGS